MTNGEEVDVLQCQLFDERGESLGLTATDISLTIHNETWDAAKPRDSVEPKPIAFPRGGNGSQK
jgi:hypothetical protein